METDDVRWSIPCLDFANRPRTLHLVLTRPAGFGLLVPPGEAAILLPDQIGDLINTSRHARAALLRGVRPGVVVDVSSGKHDMERGLI